MSGLDHRFPHLLHLGDLRAVFFVLWQGRIMIGGLYIALLAVITLAGLWRLPDKRVGTDPYCASCGYCLFGAPGPLCPECGAKIEGNVVIGKPLLSPTWQNVVQSSVRIMTAAAIAGILLILVMI